ncbi:hypothetical protein KKG90_06440 [Candidatus Bipolaricaulota bacterium]|nr:hypothetical protein [Candidatus Bipolaricaulota bacterium]
MPQAKKVGGQRVLILEVRGNVRFQKQGAADMNDAIRTEEHSGHWEQVAGTRPKLLRLTVPGGWLVTVSGGASYPVTFYSDPEHAWNPPIRS